MSSPLPVATFPLFAVGLLLLVGLAADPILQLVGGSQVAGGGWLLRIYCVVTFGVLSVAMMNFVFRAKEATFPIFLAPLVAAVFSFSAAVPLARTYGIAGIIFVIGAAQFVIIAVEICAGWRILRLLLPGWSVVSDTRTGSGAK